MLNPFHSDGEEPDIDPYDYDMYTDNVAHPFDITSKVEQDEIIYLRDSINQLRASSTQYFNDLMSSIDVKER